MNYNLINIVCIKCNEPISKSRWLWSENTKMTLQTNPMHREEGAQNIDYF